MRHRLIVVSDFATGRLNRVARPGELVPFTPERQWRYADLIHDAARNRLIAIREDHELKAGYLARLGDVATDLLRVDVEGRHEADVTHVVPAEHDVHEAGDVSLERGVAVVLDALHQRAGAVADTDDRDPHLAAARRSRSRRRVLRHVSFSYGRVRAGALRRAARLRALPAGWSSPAATGSVAVSSAS